MQLQLVVHLLHIDPAHPVDGLVAFPDHVGGDPHEDSYAQGQNADQADPQKRVFFFFMALLIPPAADFGPCGSNIPGFYKVR